MRIITAPMIANIAPRTAQSLLSSMKLDAGQWI